MGYFIGLGVVPDPSNLGEGASGERMQEQEFGVTSGVKQVLGVGVFNSEKRRVKVKKYLIMGAMSVALLFSR